MDFEYTWKKLFPGIDVQMSDNGMVKMCLWISRCHEEKKLSRAKLGNLIFRIRNDFKMRLEDSFYADFILNCENYEDFLSMIPSYTSMRCTFPSRDKQPLDPACLPLSNEKMYGKGINSRVGYE